MINKVIQCKGWEDIYFGIADKFTDTDAVHYETISRQAPEYDTLVMLP